MSFHKLVAKLKQRAPTKQ